MARGEVDRQARDPRFALDRFAVVTRCAARMLDETRCRVPALPGQLYCRRHGGAAPAEEPDDTMEA